MLIPVRVDDKIDTVIIGYGPGKNGKPKAIVIWPVPAGGYAPLDVELSQCRFIKLPEKIERKLRRQAKRLRTIESVQED